MPNWQPTVSPDDVKEGIPHCVRIEGKRIAIYRLGEELFALDDICTHEYAHLSEGFVDGETVECPLHQACFSIRTGKALTAPATVDLQRYAVEVQDGMVMVDLPTQDA